MPTLVVFTDDMLKNLSESYLRCSKCGDRLGNERFAACHVKTDKSWFDYPRCEDGCVNICKKCNTKEEKTGNHGMECTCGG